MSEFSREALLNIIETDHVQCGEASALARMALAALDSEPVAWLVGEAVLFNPDTVEAYAKRSELPVTALYHAHPASIGNSPEIPEGWIPVSERMPEDEQEVLTVNRMGHRFVSFFDKHTGLFFDRLDVPAASCIEHVLVTHWMPLPAAPQEVKP